MALIALKIQDEALGETVGCGQQYRQGFGRAPTLSSPYPRRILTVDNNVIYGEDTVCLPRG